MNHEDQIVLTIGEYKSTLIDTEEPLNKPETAYLPRLTYINDIKFGAINSQAHIKTRKSGLVILSEVHNKIFPEINLTEFYRRLMAANVRIYVANRCQYYYIYWSQLEDYPFEFDLQNNLLRVTRLTQNQPTEVNILPMLNAMEIRWKLNQLKNISNYFELQNYYYRN